jgi:extradiol dioxygenase family protein
MKLTPFHLAVPVRDLAESRKFYGELLNCEEGRSSEHWIDFNFFGHQFVVHLNEALGKDGSVSAIKNAVDGHGVPVPHFGIVLDWEDWEKLSEYLKGKVEFVIEPYIRFKGKVGEQGTMFFYDPSGNALEFKAFRDVGQLFAK